MTERDNEWNEWIEALKQHAEFDLSDQLKTPQQIVDTFIVEFLEKQKREAKKKPQFGQHRIG